MSGLTGFAGICLLSICMAFVVMGCVFVFGLVFSFLIRFLEVVYEMFEDAKGNALKWIEKRCPR